MSDYYRKRQREVDNSMWIWIGVVGVILLAIGLIVNAFAAVELRDLRNDLASIEERKTAVFETNLPAAEKLVGENAPRYAKRYSADLPDQLQRVNENLRSGGSVDSALASANEALNKKDVNTARTFRDQADLLVKDAEGVITRILGPPAYYDELARKSAEVESYIATVGGSISSARTSIDDLKQDLWNLSKGVVFARSYRRLDEANSQLTNAKEILTTPLLNDNVQFDRVAAYDAAVTAQTIVNEANDWANSDQALARNADSAITNAGASITAAETYVFVSSYNTWQARQTVDTAKTTLSQARAAFTGGTGTDPNYQLAYDLAINAKSQADLAVWQATEPTPTPEPPPTAVPSVHHNDDSGSPSVDWGSSDSDSGSSWDWGSSDSDSGSSWDSGGSDDWGGSDSWDSSDDWGDSDSWDSSDSWSSDDGW